jgi:hypothetical protein
MDVQAASMVVVRIMDGAKQVFSLLTLLDEPDVTRLAIGDPKSGSALQPESGGNRGDAGSHPFPSP